MTRLRKTKIIFTIGPASSSASVIEQLVLAGMDVARINFSHGTHQEHARNIQLIRETAERLKSTAAILQDLPGPKARVGKLGTDEVLLKEGEEFTLTTAQVTGNERMVPVNMPSLPHDVKPGNFIFLDDGAIKLEVQAISGDEIKCQVWVGGVLRPEKGINVPGVKLSVPSVTEQDLKHLAFGLEQGVDFIALSFVREANDIIEVKRFISEKGSDVPVLAKIEKHEALDSIDEILDVADGIMVARGDLGVEIPLQKVPLAQKSMVGKCNKVGKPVIIATQMLESMIASSRPTRAEVADVANAIFDGTDAIMLSGETAIGKYPVEAAKMMVSIAAETEEALPYEHILEERGQDLEPQTDDAISYDACHTAHQLGAAAIVAFTSSGSTAWRVAKYRPRVPILAITPSEVTRKRLALCWGAYSCLAEEVSTVDELFAQGIGLARETGLAKSGDLIVITAGLPIGQPGSTNLLRVAEID